MSRTFRIMRGVKYREGNQPFHKCTCERCVRPNWKDRRGLTIKEDLKL